MFKIDSKIHKPDIKYMVDRVEDLMKQGIKLCELQDVYKQFNDMREDLKNSIQSEYGIVNPNSGQQIVNYMQSLNNPEVYEACCIDGKWTSNKDALGELYLMGYEFASDILDYRLAKTYAQTVESLIKAQDSNGRIHPTVSLGKTNRINYSGPALMNIPKALLWLLVQPREDGNILFSVDIKNQEPSILINLLDIQELKPALLSEKGLYESLFSKPFSQKTKTTIYLTDDQEPRIVPASEMAESNIPPAYYTPIRPCVDTVYYNNEKVKVIEVCNSIGRIGCTIPLQDKVSIETVDGNIYNVDVEWDKIPNSKRTGIFEVSGTIHGLDIRCEGIYRKEFKQSWNAMTYGASIMGIRAICKHIDGDVIYKYFNKIPQFKEYKSKCNKAASNGIQHINTLFKTPMEANVYETSRLKRVLMDMPIQGTGADILSLLIKHFDEEVVARSLEGKLMLYYTRHDELILEANRYWVEEVGIDTVVSIIIDIVEHQIDDWTPFKVEVKKIEHKNINDIINTEESLFE